MQFAAQYMAETLHRHESTSATQWLERRRRAEDDAAESDDDTGPVRRHPAWAQLFGHGKGQPARLAHR